MVRFFSEQEEPQQKKRTPQEEEEQEEPQKKNRSEKNSTISFLLETNKQNLVFLKHKKLLVSEYACQRVLLRICRNGVKLNKRQLIQEQPKKAIIQKTETKNREVLVKQLLI